MRSWIGRFLATLAAGALVLSLLGCAREPEPALRIGTNVWIGSEPLYLARELGRFDPAAVQLVEYPSASEVLRAFRNQAIDGMVISLDELFGLAVEGFDPRIILVVDVSHGADVVVGRNGMRTMHDLKGRSVAVESSALGAFVLSRALAVNNMQPSDVNVVHLESNEQPAAFEKGQVDGAVTFDPYNAQFLLSGAQTLFDSTQIPGEIVDLLAVPASAVQQRPKQVQALLNGWVDAAVYVQRELGIPDEKLNVNGGAIALGHPLGCTGAKLSSQIIYELGRRQKKWGIVSMCIGGGMGAAGLFERV
jgi:NitT/TauT family transport system substrate-binding protein